MPTVPSLPNARRTRRPAVLAVLAAVLLAGCTTTVAGTASPATTASSTPSSAPSSTSAPSTASAPPPGQVTPAPAVGPGTGAEARRIAAVTSLPMTVSPGRTDSCFPSGPFGTASGIDGIYFGDGRMGAELERWGFVAGWGTCARDTAGNGTLVLLTEVSDPASATAAADALNTLSLDLGDEDDEPLDLPALGVTGVLSTGGSDSAGAPTDTVQAWVATGRMLAYTYLDAPGVGSAVSWWSPSCRTRSPWPGTSGPPRRTRWPTCRPTRSAWPGSR